MLKKLLLATALAATPVAFAQQNVDITGPNLSSGKADATLAALGRKAAASGNQLVITAPPEWHAKIAAKIRAGGNANIVMRDGFYENVLVRVEPKASAVAEPAKEVARADVEKSRAQAEKAKADAEKSRAEAAISRAQADKMKAEAEKAKAEAELAKAQAETAEARARQAQMASAKPATAPAKAIAAPAARAPTDTSVQTIRVRFEKSLKGGRAADGDVSAANLETGDTVYVDGPVRAVTRREGNRMALYWLDGNLDLRRSELKVLGTDRYQVVAPVRGEAVLRKDASSAASLDAREPPADSPVRLALEKSLNDGRSVESTVTPVRLRSGDMIYTNGNSALVVRRSGSDLARYWLIGNLDLNQSGLLADGTDKYKVTSDTIR